MPANTRSPNDPLTEASQPDAERLSQNGQLLGIAIYGGLLLVGFFFGVVTGYEKPVVVVKKESPKPEAPKPEPPKMTPKLTPEPSHDPKKKEPEPEPKKKEPEPEPKKIDPIPEPKKVDPTPEPKKEVTQTVVFKDVFPVLKKHCTECHGAGKAQAGVNVTTIANMMASKGKGRLLVPGKPDDSALYTSIIDGEMPKDNRTTLTDKEKMLIHDWIKGGAKE